jgi:hypothetical protein
VEFVDKYGDLFYFSFPTQSPNDVVVRRYYENGNKQQETEYQNGKKHGRDLGWYKNGNKHPPPQRHKPAGWRTGMESISHR